MANSTSTPAGFTGGPIEVIYSADKGRTFHHVLSQLALEQDEVPADIWPVYVGLDYPYLAIGPDATNLKYDTVWMSIGDAIDGDAPNEYQQRIWGLRVKGLGVAKIDCDPCGSMFSRRAMWRAMVRSMSARAARS